MWKLVPCLSRRLFQTERSFKSLGLRCYLSDSFKLENAWNERLTSPILKKINISDMFYELDNQFNHFAYASALDIDLFVNAVDDDVSFDEVEEVVHKLRLSPEAINILPSTQHALIRLYLKCNKIKDLMRILDDRLNYGVFLDDYCSLLLMDTFIKEGNFKDAAKVSSIRMLQEDFSHPLINYMSLYSCHKYLENPVPWNEEDEKSNDDGSNEDDDEVIKVRVRYIRNPYFDDHFDLVDPKHLIGKNLTFISSEIDDDIGRTYKLLGLLLHDKLDKAIDYIKLLSTSNSSIVKDGLTMANNILNDKCKVEGKDERFQGLISELQELLNKSFPESKLDTKANLLVTVEDRLKDLVNKSEVLETKKQLEIYKEWERNRARLLEEQIEKINRQKQLAEVERTKQHLKEKEEELFFFDNEYKLDLIIEEKEKQKEEQRERLRAKQPKKKIALRTIRKDADRTPPPVETFFDENIPMKLVKTKL